MMAVRFGKLPVKGDYQVRRFQHYLLSNAALPPPPPRYCVLDTLHGLSEYGRAEELFPLNGNDRLQNCTVVALAHAMTAATAVSATPVVMPAAQVIGMYRRMTGGADDALALTDVLNSGKMNPELPAGGIRAFLSVDSRNHRHVRLAMRMFGGLCFGFQVPMDCVDAFERGMPWTPGVPTNAGHAACAIGYDEAGVQLLTWGRVQRGTWEWWNECVDEVYAILPARAPRRWPLGLDVRQFEVDVGLRHGDTHGEK